jgi:hypothetical protein
MRTTISAVITLLFSLLTVAVYGQFYNPKQFFFNVSTVSKADFNNDNQSDLVGIDLTRLVVRVLLGDGLGGFSRKDTLITGVKPRRQCGKALCGLAIGDFNGDGFPDVAFSATDTTTSEQVVAIMFGNGDGTFQPAREAVKGMSGRIIVGDFNGDGKADLAVANAVHVAVLLGKGDGTFSQPLVTSLFGSQCMAAADFNHDGKLDLAFGQTSSITVLFGNGDGTFEKNHVSVQGAACPLVVADVNQDGAPDLIASDAPSQPTLMVFLNDGTGHFPKSSSYTTSGFVENLAVGDFGGNGSPDIAASNQFLNDVSILLNKGDGTFRMGKTFDLGGLDVVAGDFRSKKKGHKLDLVVLLFGRSATDHVALLPGNGDGTFQDNLAQNGLYGSAVQVGDFNGDHKLDLITQVGVLLGMGNGTFANPIQLRNGCAGQSYAIGDFNHDGKLDIAVPRGTGGGVNVCLGNGNGTFRKPVVYDRGIPHGSVQAGDFNNDGKLDLAASDSGGISILLGNGDGTFQSGIATALDASFPNFRLGDFNGDGKLDVVTVTNSGIEVLPGKGDGTFGSPIISANSAGADSMEVGDLNNDGKLDLVTESGAAISVQLGKGDGRFKSPVTYATGGSGTPNAVLGDFNGDGKLDVAVMPIDAGMALVFLGKGDGTLTGPNQYDIRAQDFAITAGDFTGDGDLDVLLLQDRGLEVLLNVK